MRRPNRAVAVSLAAVALAGLGVAAYYFAAPGRGSLTGKVTYRKQPVAAGTVQAIGADGVPRSALIRDGSYLLANLPTGPVKLSVSSPPPSTPLPQTWRTKGPAGPTPAGKEIRLPSRYASFGTSGLQTEVRSGENRFDLELE